MDPFEIEVFDERVVIGTPRDSVADGSPASKRGLTIPGVFVSYVRSENGRLAGLLDKEGHITVLSLDDRHGWVIQLSKEVSKATALRWNGSKLQVASPEWTDLWIEQTPYPGELRGGFLGGTAVKERPGRRPTAPDPPPTPWEIDRPPKDHRQSEAVGNDPGWERVTLDGEDYLVGEAVVLSGNSVIARDFANLGDAYRWADDHPERHPDVVLVVQSQRVRLA